MHSDYMLCSMCLYLCLTCSICVWCVHICVWCVCVFVFDVFTSVFDVYIFVFDVCISVFDVFISVFDVFIFVFDVFIFVFDGLFRNIFPSSYCVRRLRIKSALHYITLRIIRALQIPVTTSCNRFIAGYFSFWENSIAARHANHRTLGDHR